MILPLLINIEILSVRMMAKPTIRMEAQRKFFHSLMILVVVVNWIGTQTMLPIHGPLLSIGFTGICLVFFVGFEFTRVRVYGYFPFRHITDRVMRPREKTRLGASVYFAVGTLLTFLSLYLLSNSLQAWFSVSCPLMLTGWLAVTAVLVSAIGDGAAAIVGIKYGRRKLKGNRTLEGAIGGFVFGYLAFLPLWFFLGIHWVFGLIAASVLFLVDLTSPSINDNLVNPVAIGFALAFFEITVVILMNLGAG
jgi:dolichol kinase